MQILIRFTSYAFNIVEIFLALRFLLRMANANSANTVVRIIYDVSSVALIPFHAIFPPTTVEGSVVEWSTLTAMAIYALLAYIVLHFLLIVRNGNAPLSEEDHASVRHH